MIRCNDVAICSKNKRSCIKLCQHFLPNSSPFPYATLDDSSLLKLSLLTIQHEGKLSPNQGQVYLPFTFTDLLIQ